LEGFGEGVELGERWKGAGGRREVEYLILLAEIVGLKEWIF
jgi:hypothetical protein